MPAKNQQLAQIFKAMSAIYDYLGDSFRSLAYQRAYRIIGSIQDDLSALSEKELEEIEGIGKGMAAKIIEYFTTGKIAKYEELKKSVPHEFVDLIELKGFGPKTVKKIHDELGITTRAQLMKALKDGTIAALKGFGEKKVENMLKGLQAIRTTEERILLWDAMNIARSLTQQLQQLPEVKKIETAGSIRRRKETIGDVDILISAAAKDCKKIMDYFTTLPEVEEVLAQGDTKSSVIIKDHHRQVDVRILQPDEWGAALQYFTGSKEHSVHVREIAKQKGLKLSEYGVFNNKTGRRVAGKTEEEVYKSIGLQWMPPEMREDTGEVDLALKKKIPKLVTFEDVKGDLQMHSNWSDGSRSIEEIARYVKEHYHYEYIALTDHSKAVRIAGGMTDKDFLKQLKEIRRVNRLLGADFLKAGAEVDINPDGSLDLPNEILAQLDWVVASIHSKMNQDNTERLVKACKNPFVHVIGHPTGRLLGSREGYPVDIERLVTAAKETGTALEINGQPERM
ncbi:MAG TPA: DNA polymerase/3'-5' exonuclease PolX, partial [Chitinophagales bacterium]|nr:DNA polymerase/3'-5' exonuclease PolX [Chitinophagales bacterium]